MPKELLDDFIFEEEEEKVILKPSNFQQRRQQLLTSLWIISGVSVLLNAFLCYDSILVFSQVFTVSEELCHPENYLLLWVLPFSFGGLIVQSVYQLLFPALCKWYKLDAYITQPDIGTKVSVFVMVGPLMSLAIGTLMVVLYSLFGLLLEELVPLQEFADAHPVLTYGMAYFVGFLSAVSFSFFQAYNEFITELEDQV